LKAPGGAKGFKRKSFNNSSAKDYKEKEDKRHVRRTRIPFSKAETMTQGIEPRARVMTTPKAAKSPVLPNVQMAAATKGKTKGRMV
jgi:hypothetical protein